LYTSCSAAQATKMRNILKIGRILMKVINMHQIE
jgi:hypothetical protein